MKVVNVKANEVFNMLAHGNEVYAINPKDDTLLNLFYEAVTKVHDYLTDSIYAFFIIESEDE